MQIAYIQQGRPLRISADHCILACYNGLILHLCPEMRGPQKEGLRYGVKVPFVYANVLLENGRAFSKLGVTITQCPNDPFQWVSAAPTMTTGGYEPPVKPEDPMAVFMMGSPTPATEEEGTGPDLLRVSRHKIYATSFGQYEKEIRDQLQAMLGKHGFNHETDICAITVTPIPTSALLTRSGVKVRPPRNWARPVWPDFNGNSDSDARPYMDAAFDAAWRAVEEQT